MSQYHPYEIPIRGPIKDACIKFLFVDQNGPTERTFASVYELADFLKYNPQLGNMVGYTVKQKQK